VQIDLAHIHGAIEDEELLGQADARDLLAD
jgi:hypothetical protein